MINRVLVVFLMAGSALTSVAQVSESQRVAIQIEHDYDVDANIVYRVANNYEAKLDVYKPEAKTPTPVVMLIHGGGWVVGTKENYSLGALPYLQMGLAVVNVEYRLAKVSPAPAAVGDCLCALHWIGRNAKKYNFDLSKIVVTGGSAGGHLALTTAMIPSSAGFDNGCADEDDEPWTGPGISNRPKVTAVVNWFGITDVLAMLHGPEARAYAISWFDSLANRDDLAKQLSPVNYVRPDVPPILTIHGDADKLVPYAQAVRLHDELSKAGVHNQLYTIAGGGHGDFTLDQEVKAFETIDAFLASVGVKAMVH
jgi:acetyl esterase/lipase